MQLDHDITVAARAARGRIWIDGCFDFSHHGHAGAMLQARRLGTELYVGVHSDEEILENKGPTVMSLEERIAAVDACRWSTTSIPNAPYVTSLPFIDKYNCRYVVHGDDITSDSSGQDCYRYVKAAKRMLLVRRTPGISTTDLVGRMLLCTRSHFIISLPKALSGEDEEGAGDAAEEKARGREMCKRIEQYAADESGLAPGVDVWLWVPVVSKEGGHNGNWVKMVDGRGLQPGQRVVYVDGGFDLFCSGHIEFLRQVTLAEEAVARKNGWYEDAAVAERKQRTGGKDYPPMFLVAGVHDDMVINKWKGVNYPIMNIFERALCVLQCKYIHALVLSAPWAPLFNFFNITPYHDFQAIYHGPTSYFHVQDATNTDTTTTADGSDALADSFNPVDPYVDAKQHRIFREIGPHAFQNVNASEIVGRIMKGREAYEARQRAKGFKAEVEEAERERQIARG